MTQIRPCSWDLFGKKKMEGRLEAHISGLLEIKLGRIPGVDEGAWEMRLAENSVESNTSLSSPPPPPLALPHTISSVK